MEQWVLIENRLEENAVWDELNDLLNFTPNSGDKTQCPFDFSKINGPVAAYDISGISITAFEAHNENGHYRITDEIAVLKSVFVDCMGTDEFMYALDWQHSVFKYNPRIEAAYDHYEIYRTLPNETRAYYPDFHPDGDYYFFVAKDFSWGYLTHPWQRKVWFYGAKLVELIKKYEQRLGLSLSGLVS